MSDIQDYIEYIIKNHETLTKIPPTFVFLPIELIIDLCSKQNMDIS